MPCELVCVAKFRRAARQRTNHRAHGRPGVYQHDKQLTAATLVERSSRLSPMLRIKSCKPPPLYSPAPGSGSGLDRAPRPPEASVRDRAWTGKPQGEGHGQLWERSRPGDRHTCDLMAETRSISFKHRLGSSISCPPEAASICSGDRDWISTLVQGLKGRHYLHACMQGQLPALPCAARLQPCATGSEGRPAQR